MPDAEYIRFNAKTAGENAKAIVKMAIENCTETQRKYTRAFACGYSADEIGKLYGCSRQAVNQAKNRCREKLRDCVS